MQASFDTAAPNPQDRDEAQERRHLNETLSLLEAELESLTEHISTAARSIQERKEHLWENRRDMDFVEKADYRSAVNLSVALGERAVLTRERVARLLQTPYFARVDFRGRGDARPDVYYIGVHTFFDPKTREIRIFDWRAPVSSLFYDFESGEASFVAPAGTTYGEITRKRQYKIRSGQLEFMFESSLNIGDDILQRELSQSADEKMKNIVATIQREQNAVIRNETAEVLILQGVAGSGKTSIALHRVAFLLYRFKETLSSDDVMILSPNKVFGDYIADVLPELGEQKVAETDFSKIADKFLSKVTDYETFNEQVATLLHRVDDAASQRIRYKATPQFVTQLDDWVTSCTDEFVAREVTQKYKHLSAQWVADTFDEWPTLPIFARLDRVANTAAEILKNEVVDRGGKWSGADTTSVRKQVRAMFPHKDAFGIYKAFYGEPERRKLFKPLSRRKIEYADVFPLIYVMLTTGRLETYQHIRHLVVDEMQDYTAIQYAVLRQLFDCKMTILGDSSQSVNPFSSSTMATIRSMFPEADCLELLKSYRSTTEITEFAQNISRNNKLVPIARHGPTPGIIAADGAQLAHIVALAERHGHSEHRSLGIICKTVEQAATLYRELAAAGVDLTLLDYDSTVFHGGIVITGAHLSKGLEFDSVIIPDVDDLNYSTEMDRCMLYIACTRAMHELHLIHDGPLSHLLEFAAGAATTAPARAG